MIYDAAARVELRDNANLSCIHTTLGHALDLVRTWDGDRIRAAEIRFENRPATSAEDNAISGGSIIALLSAPTGIEAGK
ncbi:hypothetical protein [Novosphingobium sp. FSW06-99]|uniref:hypothetical protein n=1 Tax=Novosphingobium sp. FSW06-99 TaxID=1739113 RepID=UPI001E62167B|nr:hypothetical protein [Novosphingobium sp. FSW06-99]